MDLRTGDYVKVTNKRGTMLGTECLRDGDVLPVLGVLPSGAILVPDKVNGGFPLTIALHEIKNTVIKEEN